MIKNKVFILFREKLAIITLFLFFIPYFSYGQSITTNNGNSDRYILTEDLLPEEYASNTVYLPYCGDIGESIYGEIWPNYPSADLPESFNNKYPICLKLRYCSDIRIDKNGNKSLYFPTPGYDDNGKPVINCYKKSCIDLTTEELEMIYLHINNLNSIEQASEVNLSSTNENNANLYNFCSPYKYKNRSVRNTLGNSTSIGMISDEYVYCHEFAIQDLDYLIPDVRGYQAKDGEPLFQCKIHQCPPSSSNSLSCYTNFWLFDYVDTNDNNKIIRDENYKSKYVDTILFSSNNSSNSSIINTTCTPIYCQEYRYSKQLQCSNNNTLNPSCDNYVGLDKFFQDNSTITNIMQNYVATPQQCVNNFCQQTVDCSLAEHHGLDPSCVLDATDAGNIDNFLSYFYRPTPPQTMTEILPITRNMISGNKRLSDSIYSNDYNLDNYKVIYNANESINSHLLLVTAIKRLMRGAEVHPLPAKPGETLEGVERKTGGWGSTNYIALKFDNTNNSKYLKDYFHYLTKPISSRAINNICFNNSNDFKTYGFRQVHSNRVHDLFWWNEGDYYFSKTNNAKNFITLNNGFSLPICEPSDNSDANSDVLFYRLNNTGLSALCNIGTTDHDNLTPRSDAYYIKGTPTFEWYSNMKAVKSVTVNVCLRVETRYDNKKMCGARECIISCVNSDCSQITQACSVDNCVELVWTDGEKCNMDNVAKNMEDIKTDPSKKLGCYQIVTEYRNDKVRFRIVNINNKLYVFVDATRSGNGDTRFVKSTNSRSKVIITSNGDIFNDQNVSVTEYRGRLDGTNLLDNNNLIDGPGSPGYITDEDVFGEEIYEYYECAKGITNANKGLCTNAIGVENASNNNWTVWDIVQYIGNNQPQYYMIGEKKVYNPNCKVGNLKNCRGYYDADGNFFRESQGIPLPLAPSPNKFYKYAVLNNSQGLFFPMLKILSIRNYNGKPIEELDNKDEDELELSFFTPTMSIIFEHKQDPNVTVSFYESEVSRTITDSTKKYTVDYIIRKTTEGGSTPQPKVCLIRKFGTYDGKNVESVVRCMNRRKPDLNSIVIRSLYDTNALKPYLNAYFIDNTVITDKTKNTTLDGKNSIQFRKFMDKTLFSKEEIENSENLKLFDGITAEAHTYPIQIKASYCSALHYDCIDYRKQLIDNKNKLKKLNADNVSTTSDEYITTSNNITQLTNKVSRCENTIQEYCDNLSSGVYSLRTLSGCNNKISSNAFSKCSTIWQTYISNYINIRLCTINNNCNDTFKNLIKEFNQQLQAGNLIYQIENNLPSNYKLIGAENDLCVNSGFDTYFPNVVAMPSVDNSLGKCVLTQESKKRPACRRSYYYNYCTDNNDPNCKCLNGTAECDCSYGDTCVQKISCECSNIEGATNSCANLPEECYLPGYNTYKITLSDGNKADNYCECEINTTGLTANGTVIRKATAKELGLCAPVNDAVICRPIKYYDSNKFYNDGGAGEKLSVIQEKYKSNIWRTNETKEGKIKNDNLGHAEFDLSNHYTKDYFNIENQYCHNPNTGHYYILEDSSHSCQDGYTKIYATEGECRGFWTNKVVSSYNGAYSTINPLATCTLDGTFKLAPNTNCERYSCPAVNENDSNYVKSEEKYTLNINETNSTNVNRKGLSHGYANWAEYKKGTYSIDGVPLNNDLENGHGDDIEQRTAESCIYGYVPAGFSKIINKYYPVKVDNSASDGVLYFDKFVKNMLLENQDYISTSDMIINLNYNAKDHLPVRYCNQVGQWMPVDDIYTKYKINLYNLNSTPFHDLDGDGYVKIDTYKNMLYPNIETNTYGVSVDYSKKYCERSFCKAISANDVPLFLYDEHNTEVNLAGNEADPTSPFSRFLGLDDDYNVGYFANEDTINAYTVWRHTGGATWQETPGPLSDNDIRNVIGSCDASKHFYPHNAIFLQDSFTNMDNQKISYSSFEKQYNNLFSATNISISSIIKPELKKFFENTTLIQHPTRRCNKYGVWGAIENECEKACEPLDPFRTNFTYEGSGNNLKVTVLGLYKTPHLRNDYYKEIDTNTKVGDIYTGGARWGRTLAGQYAIGECDSTIKTNMQIYNANGQLVNSNQSITFISNGSKNDVIPGTTIKIGGRPYRECLPDGTWGPVHNPCRLYNACPSLNVYNADLSQYSSAVAKREIVGSLNSSSILSEDIFNNTNSIRVTSECDKRYYEEGGTISKDCIIQTQQWDSNSLNNSCILKVCPSYNKKIGNVEIINIDSSRELYYPKNSGYSGEITLSNRLYKGYSVNRFCPNLFECIDCEDTSTVKYTCVYDENTNDLIWESTGRCEPRSCSFNALVSKCNQLGSCVPRQEILSITDLIITPQDNTFSDIVFENNKKYNDDKSKFAIGSRVALLPKTNYKNNMKTYAYCDERGEWNIVGGFEPITCSMNNLEKLEGARWEKEYSTSCNNTHSNTVCHGTIEKVVCDSPTTTVGTRTAKCVVTNNVAEWQYTGSVQCIK